MAFIVLFMLKKVLKNFVTAPTVAAPVEPVVQQTPTTTNLEQFRENIKRPTPGIQPTPQQQQTRQPFASTSVEREKNLANRKRELLEQARRRIKGTPEQTILVEQPINSTSQTLHSNNRFQSTENTTPQPQQESRFSQDNSTSSQTSNRFTPQVNNTSRTQENLPVSRFSSENTTSSRENSTPTRFPAPDSSKTQLSTPNRFQSPSPNVSPNRFSESRNLSHSSERKRAKEVDEGICLSTSEIVATEDRVIIDEDKETKRKKALEAIQKRSSRQTIQ